MKIKLKLLHKLLIAIVIGLIIGMLVEGKNSIGFIVLGNGLATVNYIIAQLISFAIPIILLGFISAGVSELGASGGKILGFNLLYAYISTITAGILAYFLGSYILPFMLENSISENISNSNTIEFLPIFKLNIPPIMETMTALALAIIVGIVSSKLDPKKSVLSNLLLDVREISNFIIQKIIIPLLPIYIFTVFFKLSAGGNSLSLMGTFLKVYILIIIIHWIIIIGHYSIHAIKEGNPSKILEYIKNILPAYFTAIGTQSSVATLPVTFESSRKFNLKEETVDFSIPLNANVHMPGSMISITICALATSIITPTAETFTFVQYIPFLIILAMATVSAPGVPGGAIMVAAGFVTSMLGFTIEMQSFLIAIYLAQDSFGTAANVSCDASIAKFMNKYFKK